MRPDAEPTPDAEPVSDVGTTVVGATDTNVPVALGTPPIRRDGSILAWALLLGAAVVIPALYLQTYGGQPVHALGWDSYGYMWQTRIIGIDALGDAGTRLGVPIVGSIVVHLLGVRVTVEPVVLGLAMTVGLAAAVAAVTRIAFELPRWTATVIALVVGWWGGTARLASGYQANLLSLMLFTVAVAIFLRSRGRTGMLLFGGLMMFACGIGHPGFMPVYTGVTGAWAVLSIPRIRRDRAAGRSILRTEPVAALVSAIGTLGLVAYIVFIPLHHTVRDVADLSVVSGLFGQRLAKLPAQTGALTTIPLAVVGFFFGCRMRRGRRTGAVLALWVAWTAACVGGLVLGLVDQRFPAHRAVLFATPVAAAMGFAVAGVGRSIAGSGRPQTLSRWAAGAGAVLTMGAAIFAVAATGHHTYGDLVDSPRAYIEDPAQRTASYLATVKPTVPVIIVTNRSGIAGVLVTKLYYNATRVYAPIGSINSIFVYLGGPAQLQEGRPSMIADPTEDWMVGYNEVSQRGWPDVQRALRQGAIVLFNEEQVTPAVWEAAFPPTSRREVTPGLFILRGPLVKPTVDVTPPKVSPTTVELQVLLTLALLTVLGGGFAWACFATRGGSTFDAVAFAPAIGAGLAVIGGFAVSALRVGPGSASGVMPVAVMAAVGYGLALRVRLRRGRPSRARDGRATEEPEPALAE